MGAVPTVACPFLCPRLQPRSLAGHSPPPPPRGSEQGPRSNGQPGPRRSCPLRRHHACRCFRATRGKPSICPAAPGAVVLGSGCPSLLTAERTALSPALGFVGHWKEGGPGGLTQQVACRGYERLDSRGQITWFRWLCSFPAAAVTKHHKLGGLEHRSVLSRGPEARILRPRCWPALSPVNAPGNPSSPPPPLVAAGGPWSRLGLHHHVACVASPLGRTPGELD